MTRLVFRTIASLPESLPDLSLSTDPSRQYDSTDLDAYAESQANLVELSKRRNTAQNRLTQLQALRDLLVPYQNPQQNIQPNLVTRNGELGKELDRMRILLARVTGGIQQRKINGGEELSGATITEMNLESGMGSTTTTEKGKLEAVLMDLT